jgi:hypothetical protein
MAVFTFSRPPPPCPPTVQTRPGDTDFREKWDKQEYPEKAKKCGLEQRERMQENEERMRQGMRPRTPRTPLTHAIPHDHGCAEYQRTWAWSPRVLLRSLQSYLQGQELAYLDHINGRARESSLRSSAACPSNSSNSAVGPGQLPFPQRGGWLSRQ